MSASAGSTSTGPSAEVRSAISKVRSRGMGGGGNSIWRSYMSYRCSLRMRSVSPNPAVVTSAARAVLPSINALVTSVVACTTGARISAGDTPALARACVTPRRTPSSGAAGVVSVLSMTTRPVSPSSSTTSVKVPPMSTARRQSAIPVVLAGRREHVEDPRLADLGVADEVAVAVRVIRRRPVHVARLEDVALLGPQAEVELALEDD